jgi:hypothetical protein
MSTTSKPVFPPVISLTSTGVAVSTPSLPDTDIVVAGDNLSFTLNLDVTGWSFIVALLANEPVEVRHHIEEVETGTRTTLGPYNFTTPSPITGPFSFTTGPFTTGKSGSGAQFTTADPSDDDGVYRVITEFHFTDPGTKEISVFDDRILAITAP